MNIFVFLYNLLILAIKIHKKKKWIYWAHAFLKINMKIYLCKVYRMDCVQPEIYWTSNHNDRFVKFSKKLFGNHPLNSDVFLLPRSQGTLFSKRFDPFLIYLYRRDGFLSWRSRGQSSFGNESGETSLLSQICYPHSDQVKWVVVVT